MTRFEILVPVLGHFRVKKKFFNKGLKISVSKVKFSQESENKIKNTKKFTIFILGHSGPFSPLLKKRNGHREVPTTGRDLQIYINYLTPASFHAVPLDLENIHSFGRSLNNNILDKNGSREGPRRGSNLKIYINHLTITIFHPTFFWR